MKKAEFIEKYKDVEFQFVEHWKHKFQYEATVDGDKITVWLGDKDSDIYRNSFKAKEKLNLITLRSWQINEGEIFVR